MFLRSFVDHNVVSESHPGTVVVEIVW